MSLAVVRCGRPVLCDGRVGWNAEAISAATLEVPPVLVFERHQVELACPKMFRAEEADRVGHATTVDRILVRVSENCLQAFNDIGRNWHMPMATFIVGRR